MPRGDRRQENVSLARSTLAVSRAERSASRRFNEEIQI